jgi:O-antigen/teichoic acid export membrane protein
VPDATRRILGNSAWLTSGEVLSRLLAAAWQVLLARHLGTQLFGEFTLAMALAAILAMVSDLGLGSLVTREVSRNRERPWPPALAALRARGFLAVALGGLAVAASAVGGRSARATVLLAILAGTQLVQGQGEVLAAAHRGRERMARPVVVSFVCRLGLVLSGLAAVGLGASVEILALLTTVWALPLPLLLLADLPGPREPGPGALAFLRRAVPIGAGIALWAFSFRVGLVLLAWLRGEAEVGVYGAAFRLFEACLLLQGPLLAASFPALASGVPGEAGYGRAFRLVVRILSLLSLSLAALLVVEGEEILVALFGEPYRPAGTPLVWLGLSLPLSCLAAPMLSLLIARDRERTYTRIMAAGAVLAPALGLILIPRYGIGGAAAAALAVELVVLLAVLRPAARLGALEGVARILARTVPAGGLLALAFAAAGQAGIPFGIRVGVGMLVVMPSAAVALRVIRRRDLEPLFPRRTERP